MMKKLTLVGSTIAASITMIGFSNVAQAIPSFSRQTGLACAACHTVFPELTSFGREFKLNGYTLTGLKQIQSKSGAALPKLKINEIPAFSVMLQTSAEYDKGANPATGTHQTTQVNFPEQLSLFYGGEISPHMGAFIQVTNTNDGTGFQMDNTDIRYANHTKFGNKDDVYGVTLNNGPGMGDLWQTTPIWGFPYAGPGTANNSPLIDNMGGNVAGIGAYNMYDNHLYLQGSVYKTLGNVAGGLNDVNGNSATIKGLSPYWRLAYQTSVGSNYFEVGTFGIKSDLYPDGLVAGTTNKYLDAGLDAQYELAMGDNNMVVRTSYIHQKADLDATAPGTSRKLNEFKLNGSYNFGNSKAVSLGYVHAGGDPWGTAPNEVNTGTNAWIAQGSYLPWQNVKLSLQYVAYTKLNGTSTNASNANTAYLVGWFMF